MSDVKIFDFAAGKRAQKAQIAGEFGIGDQMFQVRVLKDANIAYLIAGINHSDDPMKVITRVLNFMERALTPESAARFEKLALGSAEEGDDGLELTDIMEVFRHVLSIVAAGNPTGSSNGSSASRKRTGARSTATAGSGA